MTIVAAAEPSDAIAFAQRVAMVAARASSAPTRVLAAEVEAIRAAASACGHHPAVAVTQAISAALERGERGALVQAWLAVLRDTVLSERHEAPTRTARLATGPVRLHG